MSNSDTAVASEKAPHQSAYLRTAELEGFLTASLDSLTPALVQRMVGTMSQMVELMDLMNTDEMKSLLATASEVAESLETSLRTLKEMEDGGAIAGLAEMGVFIDAMKKSMTSSIAIRSLSSLMSLADTGTEVVDAVRESAQEAKEDTSKLGPIGMLRALKDPELQQSLKFILSFSKKVPSLVEKV